MEKLQINYICVSSSLRSFLVSGERESLLINYFLTDEFVARRSLYLVLDERKVLRAFSDID